MKNMPRILPLVGIAMGGVLAINAIAGAQGAPNLFSGARAFAEEAVKGDKKAKAEEQAEDAKAADEAGSDAAAKAPAPPSAMRPAAICAPTAAELAKQAGLSPAELQVLQSLGERRGQLDQREDQLGTQLALLAAAEAKLDAKVKALNTLKTDIQGLVTQANTREETEIARLVKVFEGMKPKDAAPRMVALDDSVLLPIASKMKERALSPIIAQMSPEDAKRLTESLAKRYAAAKVLGATMDNAATAAASKAAPPAQAANAAPAEKAAPAPKAAPKKQAQVKPKPKPKAAPAQTAQASAPAAAAPAPAAAAAAPAAATPG